LNAAYRNITAHRCSRLQCGCHWLQKKSRAWWKALLSYALMCDAAGSRNEIGGLGSSHTAPCGAAVPARPPTRSSETTHPHGAPQWVRRATRRSTSVVVQRAPFFLRSPQLDPVNPIHCYKICTAHLLIRPLRRRIVLLHSRPNFQPLSLSFPNFSSAALLSRPDYTAQEAAEVASQRYKCNTERFNRYAVTREDPS
jgi:hypothetical protein